MLCYIITERQMANLSERLELTKARASKKEYTFEDMYRLFNYEVQSWIQDMKQQ